MSLFQSNLRKQIRNLPKILNFVKKITIIQNYSLHSLVSIKVQRALDTAEPPKGPKSQLLSKVPLVVPGRRLGRRVSKISKNYYSFKKFHWQILKKKNCKILQISWWARSRLYHDEILQENMRLTAFFKLYKICIHLHRCNLKILAKNGFRNQQFS